MWRTLGKRDRMNKKRGQWKTGTNFFKRPQGTWMIFKMYLTHKGAQKKTQTRTGSAWRTRTTLLTPSPRFDTWQNSNYCKVFKHSANIHHIITSSFVFIITHRRSCEKWRGYCTHTRKQLQSKQKMETIKRESDSHAVTLCLFELANSTNLQNVLATIHPPKTEV